MLYSTNSPYYRQFLSSTANKKYQKNLEKQAGSTPALEQKEQKGIANTGSVGE